MVMTRFQVLVAESVSIAETHYGKIPIPHHRRATAEFRGDTAVADGLKFCRDLVAGRADLNCRLGEFSPFQGAVKPIYQDEGTVVLQCATHDEICA